jgi:MoxR-like ATPase
MLLSLMETGILTQTMHKKVRQTHLKTWVFATSNGTKKLSEALLSRFRVYVNQYDFAQFYEISVKQLLDKGLSEYAADEITKSVWEQLKYFPIIAPARSSRTIQSVVPRH